VSTRLSILAATALLTAPAHAAVPPLPTVPFRTVAQDEGASSSISERKNLTIRSERRWHRIWDRLATGEAAPEIDFRRHMVIVVTQGRQPSSGHSIQVERIRRTGRGWRVEVTEVEPGPGCVTGGVITSPYHVVRVKRSGKRPRFERERTEVACR
jgi:PrcB C-terminal